MGINSQHLTGFAIGLGASALGFYLYKRNQSKVDAFLNEHGTIPEKALLHGYQTVLKGLKQHLPPKPLKIPFSPALNSCSNFSAFTGFPEVFNGNCNSPIPFFKNM